MCVSSRHKKNNKKTTKLCVCHTPTGDTSRKRCELFVACLYEQTLILPSVYAKRKERCCLDLNSVFYVQRRKKTTGSSVQSVRLCHFFKGHKHDATEK